MGAAKKITVVMMSVVVAVAVGLAATVGIRHAAKNVERDYPGMSPGISTSYKAIFTICQSTDYNEICVQTLSKYLAKKNAGNDTATDDASGDPKDLVKAAFAGPIDEVRAAHTLSTGLKNKTNEKEDIEALTLCQGLLRSAEEELHASMSKVGKNDLATLPKRAKEFKNWLSAVVSYQQTCIDGVEREDLKEAMAKGLKNATRMTSNALAIITDINSIVYHLRSAFDSFKPSSRRLLEVDSKTPPELDREGFPAWLSDSDRRLLASDYIDALKVRANAVVAMDGSGNFKSISEAVRAAPKKSRSRWTIYVKAGVYRENVLVDKNTSNLLMFGDGPMKTIVTGNKNKRDGVLTYQSATFAVEGNGFIGKWMGFRNTAGPAKHEAVALRVKGDLVTFYNCRMDGYQATLYVQTHRQFYSHCTVSGTVDFIFGDAAVVLQSCLLLVRKPLPNQDCTITAQGRADRHESTGIVIHSCRILPESDIFARRFSTKTYLGRPWKEHARTVFMESTIGDFIQPARYKPWDGNFALNTLYFAEYSNLGPGVNTGRRVRWPGMKVLTRREALKYTVGSFIQGNAWLKYTGAPYILGLLH